MFSQHTQRFSVGLKVAIVFLAAGYIAWRLSGKHDAHFSFPTLFSSIAAHAFLFCAVLLLMPLNWLLEAWKWKKIAQQVVPVSFYNALRGVLAGVTIGTATPNRVGEFAGRIFMVEEGDRVELFLLSFISGFAQVLVTIVAGLFGFAFHPEVAGLDRTELIFLSAGTVLFFTIPFWLNFFPGKWMKKAVVLKKFPRKIFLEIVLLSFLRYAVYVFQFFLVLLLCGVKVEAGTALACITVSYFIVTVIPTFSFTEVLVRGGVAGLVFSNGGGDFDLAFTAAVTLWMINVALPSLLGSVFVFRLKFPGKA